MCKYFCVEDLIESEYFQSKLCENCPAYIPTTYTSPCTCRKCDFDLSSPLCLRRKELDAIDEEFTKLTDTINSILDKKQNP